MKRCDYEPRIVPYEWKAVYLPDFVPKDRPDVLIEAKGFFRDRREVRKYIAIAESNPDITLVFIFMYPNKPMPGARRRKNGTKYTVSEWADSHGFVWYTEYTLPKEWCK